MLPGEDPADLFNQHVFQILGPPGIFQTDNGGRSSFVEMMATASEALFYLQEKMLTVQYQKRFLIGTPNTAVADHIIVAYSTLYGQMSPFFKPWQLIRLPAGSFPIQSNLNADPMPVVTLEQAIQHYSVDRKCPHHPIRSVSNRVTSHFSQAALGQPTWIQ